VKLYNDSKNTINILIDGDFFYIKPGATSEKSFQFNFKLYEKIKHRLSRFGLKLVPENQSEKRSLESLGIPYKELNASQNVNSEATEDKKDNKKNDKKEDKKDDVKDNDNKDEDFGDTEFIRDFRVENDKDDTDE